MFQNIGEIVLLFWRTLCALPFAWRQRHKIFEQFFEIGNASLLMVCVLSFFIGAVIALQTGPVLVERGLASAVGGLVGISVAKELAPVMMAILIAGRVGSAMAAEIGSMRVYQEIDALRTMNINPIHYLVLPRVLLQFSSAGLAVQSWLKRTAISAFRSQLFLTVYEILLTLMMCSTACSKVFVSPSSSAPFRAIKVW
jgi:ABC transport permease subunit